jgi:hypothetical protein
VSLREVPGTLRLLLSEEHRARRRGYVEFPRVQNSPAQDQRGSCPPQSTVYVGGWESGKEVRGQGSPQDGQHTACFFPRTSQICTYTWTPPPPHTHTYTHTHSETCSLMPLFKTCKEAVTEMVHRSALGWQKQKSHGFGTVGLWEESMRKSAGPGSCEMQATVLLSAPSCCCGT